MRKPHGGRLRVALAFPNTYFVGMSNLGFQTVYRLFNDQPDIVCERVVPAAQAGTRRRCVDAGTPLVTLESQTPVGDFDVLAFSVSFEWDYTNVLTLLRLAGMPLRAAERDHRHPLVVIGGAVTFVNPEPLAPFADVIAAGEGEVLVPSLVDAVAAPPSRGDLLQRLARERGFYVPSFYESRYDADGRIAAFVPREAPARRRSCARRRSRRPRRSTRRRRAIFTPDTEFGSRFLVEVVRGCANLCRFCWAGYNYLPVRAFPDRPHPRARRRRRAPHVEPRRPRVDCALRSPGHRAHPRAPARDGLRDQPGVAAARRPDATIVRVLRESGERTITIAPETGSDRLRRVINKTVTNDEILDRAELIFASGIENLKLYYMIGLPDRDRRGPGGDSRSDAAAARPDAEARAAPRPRRPHRRQREPADSEARHRLPVAADGRHRGRSSARSSGCAR